MVFSKLKGFTLIELLITISIIAVLSVIGFAVFSSVMKQGRDGKRQTDLRNLQSSLEQYFADQGFYPTETGGLDSLLQASPPPPAFTSNTGNPSPTTPPSKTYQNNPPKDPQGASYRYDAFPDSCANTSGNKCSSYCLYAKFENPPTAPFPSGCTAPPGYNFAVAPP